MFKAEQIRGLKHLRRLCNGIGGDFELRGNKPSKWIVRWDPENREFFVFQRGSNFLTIIKPNRMKRLFPGLYAGQLWTCEGLSHRDILKWPWQIRLREAMEREHKFSRTTSGMRGRGEPLPVGN